MHRKRYFPQWTGRVSFLSIRGFMTDKNRRMPPVPAGQTPTDTTLGPAASGEARHQLKPLMNRNDTRREYGGK
jgi:hypothetical protein